MIRRTSRRSDRPGRLKGSSRLGGGDFKADDKPAKFPDNPRDNRRYARSAHRL